MRSRDGFTSRRGFELDAVVIEFQKRGGTELFGFDTWRGVDTMSLHTPDSSSTSTRPCRSASAPHRTGRAGCSAAAPTTAAPSALNPIASRLALGGIRRANGYRGLQTTRDITDPQRADDRSLDFVVEVERAETHWTRRIARSASTVRS